MITRRTFMTPIVTSAGMLFVILASHVPWARGGTPDSESALALKVRPSKSKYQKLEPIQFTFAVRNETRKPVTWSGLVGFGPSTNLLVRHNGGAEVVWEGRKLLPVLVGQIPHPMQPGVEYSISGMLPIELVEKIFPEAGEYIVRVEFLYTEYMPDAVQKRTVSDELRIILSEPEGADRQAYQSVSELLKAIRAGRSDAESLELKQAFVDRFPQSVYAKFIGYELATIYEAVGQNEKALRELCKLTGTDFHLSDFARIKLNEVDRKLHPEILIPSLPEGSSAPTRPDPCMSVRKPS